MNPPDFDYKNWPCSPSEGYKTEGNNAWATQSLFLETTRFKPGGRHPAPLYTLADTAKWSEEWGVWLPSARMIYVFSQGEYDAMRKLVGAFKNWQALKALKWFCDELSNWEAEWKMREACEARVMLKVHSLENAAAAKALWVEAKAKDVGRPKKGKPKIEEPDVDNDSERILQFRSR